MGSADTWADLQEDLSPRQVELVRSTYRVMGERGVHEVSLQEIAQVAGVSKATLLYYFKTRENLILATMRWVLLRVAHRIREALATAASAEAKIRAMMDAIFIQPEANRRFYLIYLDTLGYAVRLDRFSRMSATFRAIVNGLYADVIRLGVQEGAFRVADVEEAAAAVRALIDGYFIQWLQEEDWRGRHAAYKQACTQAVLAYLGSWPTVPDGASSGGQAGRSRRRAPSR